MNENRGNLIFISGVVGLILLMVLPIPTIFLDALLALNLSIALTVLIVSLYMKRPLDFSAFPALLLMTTLFRLTLNIASTRLILLEGGNGPESAGKIINTFGNFVVGGNYVVGIIVFIILVIINFVVITKGSGRIAEVGARFTLDAMPGKQMSIDADLNAGLISEDQARKRRTEVESEADFYGAMDGASKFVRGDAIAGILITIINIIGGFIIGMTQFGMTAGESGATYTILTVGDGLVSQIPALLISTAAGIIVSRASDGNQLGNQLGSQLFSSPEVLKLVGGIMILFGLLPGMPILVFGALAAGFFFLSRSVADEDGLQVATSLGGGAAGSLELSPDGNGSPKDTAQRQGDREEAIEEILPLKVLILEIGYGLIPQVDEEQGGDLLNRIQKIRRNFAEEIGIIIPPVHVRDNALLPAGGYSLLLNGVELIHGDVVPNKHLAIDSGEVIDKIDGIDGIDPAFGLPAVWVGEDQIPQAEDLGYTVADSPTVIITHLSKHLKENASELVGTEEMQKLIDIFKKSNPKVVSSLVPDKMQLSEILKVCKNLLREQLSVRDLRTIFGALLEHVHLTQNTEILTEFVRQDMARYISSLAKSTDDKIHVITLDGALAERFRGQMKQIEGDFHLALPPDLGQAFLERLEDNVKQLLLMGFEPVLLVTPELRRPIRNLTQNLSGELMVLSHKEVVSGIDVSVDGQISIA
ncbi:MAG: flagellar biosynthesis protein FlhA [Myxococcales bacterium]|nr:flagellar biosynthesis protein FlhA [Myxococcales bacterium]